MKKLVLALAFMSSVGCVDPDAGSSPDDEAPLPDDTIVYDRVAIVGPDGEIQLSEPRPITVGEQRAQAQARLDREPAIAANGYSPSSGIPDPDFWCWDTSFWLYARTDYTGDRICFTPANGSEYQMWWYDRFTTINGRPYYAGNWEISHGSYLVGSRGGHLDGRDASGPTSRRFSTTAYAGTFQFDERLFGLVFDR